MPLILFDHQCNLCGHEFEELVDRANPRVECPLCGDSNVTRLVTGTHIDPRLGIHADAFPTMGDKWAKKQRQRKAIEMKRRQADS